LHDFAIKPVPDSTTKLRMTILAKTYRYNDKGLDKAPAGKGKAPAKAKPGAKK
jgi:type IV pilus assembly protein PilO